jgi:hypothetical protein
LSWRISLLPYEDLATADMSNKDIRNNCKRKGFCQFLARQLNYRLSIHIDLYSWLKAHSGFAHYTRSFSSHPLHLEVKVNTGETESKSGLTQIQQSNHCK